MSRTNENFPVINDDYQFDCKLCGHCCTGNMTVNLNLFDLYKMAGYLQYPNTEMLFSRSKVGLHREAGVWLPKIRFKKKPFSFCPFLINEADHSGNLSGWCKLHPAHKPLICYMAPVGRIVDLASNSESFIFVKPAPDCPGVKESKLNRLVDLTEICQHEMDYQTRFFGILDKAKSVLKTKQDYQNHLYSFNIKERFPQLLQQLEARLNLPQK